MNEGIDIQQKALLLHFQQDFQELRDMLQELELADDEEAPGNSRLRDSAVSKTDCMIQLIDQILAL